MPRNESPVDRYEELPRRGLILNPGETATLSTPGKLLGTVEQENGEWIFKTVGENAQSYPVKGQKLMVGSEERVVTESTFSLATLERGPEVTLRIAVVKGRDVKGIHCSLQETSDGKVLIQSEKGKTFACVKENGEGFEGKKSLIPADIYKRLNLTREKVFVELGQQARLLTFGRSEDGRKVEIDLGRLSDQGGEWTFQLGDTVLSVNSEGSLTVGRDLSSKVKVDNLFISARHLWMGLNDSANVTGGTLVGPEHAVELRDLASTNGTWVCIKPTGERFTQAIEVYKTPEEAEAEAKELAQAVEVALLVGLASRKPSIDE